MDNNVAADATVELPRAGFWRRLVATLIDLILVALPFQVLTAILFAMTAGMVQMHGGITFNYCAKTNTVPQSLNPPPPHDWNMAQVCHVTLFGATTGVVLTVGRVTKEGSRTKTVTQGYMVNEDGNPIDGIAMDWIVVCAFFAYLLGMIWRTGKSVGARAVSIRVADAAEPRPQGVSIRKAVVRYLVMGIGFVPAFALLVYLRLTTDGSADEMFAGSFFQLIIYCLLIAALWCLFLIVQIARKRDPLYDRLAGTMVVRDPKTHAASPT